MGVAHQRVQDFNEASAFRLRKASGSPPLRRSPLYFNEASAFRLRKVSEAGQGEGGAGASMRPQPSG